MLTSVVMKTGRFTHMPREHLRRTSGRGGKNGAVRSVPRQKLRDKCEKNGFALFWGGGGGA